MMQVWLVLIAIWCVQTAHKVAGKRYEYPFLILVAYGCVVMSAILVFVNGGTVG